MTVEMKAEEESSLLLHHNDVIIPNVNMNQDMYKQIEMEQLILRIIEQPSGIFYKDEGGKSNHMTAAALITTEGTNKRKKALPLGQISIVPRLVYENGNEVEDANEIFTILSLEPTYISTTEQPVYVKFRIEKVSRRKDGKKFRIRFDFDHGKSMISKSYKISSVMTESVVVLSKRKLSVSSNSDKASKVPKKKTKHQKEEGYAKISGRIVDKLRTAINNLESKVADLHERVSQLESENKALKFQISSEDTMEFFDDFQNSQAKNKRGRYSGISRAKGKDNNSSFESSLDEGLYPVKYEGDDGISLKPLGSRTRSSEMMNFDFSLSPGNYGAPLL